MKYTLLLAVFLGFNSLINAQYVEPEKKDKEALIRKQNEKIIYPTRQFDSIAAKNMLAIGRGRINGVASTRPRESSSFGLKTGKRVFANKMKVILFPVTPYFEEYYALWKDKSKNNPKKNTYVMMSNDATRYRLESITNSSGEFSFPDMKPGKYYIYGTLGYTTTYKGNQYTGSGYNGYGGRTDYYTPYEYYKDNSEFLELFVEVKADGEIVTVKLR